MLHRSTCRTSEDSRRTESEKGARREDLMANDHTSITAAMQARTKAHRNHQARQWEEVYEMMRPDNSCNTERLYAPGAPGRRRSHQAQREDLLVQVGIALVLTDV